MAAPAGGPTLVEGPPAGYLVRTPGGAVTVNGPQDPGLVGQQVTVADRDGSEPGVQGRARAADGAVRMLPPAIGGRKTLVVLVTTSDLGAPDPTVDGARAAVFTAPDSASALYRAQSGGKTWLTGAYGDDGDVVTIDAGVPLGACDVDSVADAVDTRLAAGGIAATGYDHVAYVLPKSSACRWAGLGEMPGRRSWTNDTVSTYVVAHELGHNMGAAHANRLRCADGGAAVSLSASCTTVEYGDPFDVMGSGPRLMSSWQRAHLGQLDAAAQLVVRGPQAVTLTSADADGGTQLALVPRKLAGRAITDYLAVELRSDRAPFDLWQPAFAAVKAGVSVRLVPRVDVIGPPALIDAAPATDTPLDAPLMPGQAISDPTYGVTVRTVGVAADHATVEVAMPTLVDDVPPSTPSGLGAMRRGAAVALGWGAATDDDALARYEIARGGTVLGTTTDTTFTDLAAPAAGGRYAVTAIDASGNRSAPAVTIVPGLGTTGRTSTQTSTQTQTSTPDATLGHVRLLAWHVSRDGRGALRYRMTFRAAHARELRVMVGGRRIAQAYAPRLTVSVRLPRRAKRRTIDVIAARDGQRAHETWTIRR